MKLLLSTALTAALLSSSALAQDIGSPSPEALEGLYPGKTYSPYAQRSFPSRVFWGDSHLHTANSPDAS